MRKILLMLALMLPCLGVWAAVTLPKVSTETEKHYYVIKNFRSHKFAYYNGDAAQLGQQTNPTSATTQENLNKYLWYVTEATGAGEGAYMLHNVATEKVYATYQSFTETGEVVYIKENPYRAGYVCVSSNEDATTKNTCWDDQGSQTKIGPYETRQNDNQGTSWEFIEITPNTTLSYTLSDNAGNNFIGTFTGWNTEMLPAITGVAGYSLSNVEFVDNAISATITFPFPVSKVDGATNWTFIRTEAVSNYQTYLYVNDDDKIVSKSLNPANGNLGYLPTAQTGELQKWQWAIYPTFSESNFTFKIKNAAQGKYVPSTANTNGDTDGIFVTEANEAGIFSWGTCIGRNGFYLANNKGVFFAANSGKEGEQTAILWKASGSHQGGNLQFTAPVYTANCKLTDNSGNNYNWTGIVSFTSEEEDIEKPQLTGVPTSLLANDTWENGAYTATLNLPFAVTNGEKVTPTFICAYGSDVYKWHAVGTGIKTTKNVAATSADVATHLWEIIPQFNNGAFTFQIKNLATGTFIYSTSNTNTHEESKVTLSATASNVTYESNGFKLSTGKYLSIGSSSGNTGAEQILGTWDNHNGTPVSFPVVKFNLEVGSTGFASLYTPVAGTFAGDVKTYAIKETSADYASLTELTGVEANQGAIIEATPGTYTFTAGEVSSDWTGNKLTGSSVNSYVAGSAYVLALVDGQAALALAALNKDVDGNEGNSYFLNNAGKAYLPASAVTSNAQALRFNIGGTTGIEEAIVAPNANEAIYDLSGRRVMNAVKGGIYIKNGKKFIVK